MLSPILMNLPNFRKISNLENTFFLAFLFINEWVLYEITYFIKKICVNIFGQLYQRFDILWAFLKLGLMKNMFNFIKKNRWRCYFSKGKCNSKSNHFRNMSWNFAKTIVNILLLESRCWHDLIKHIISFSWGKICNECRFWKYLCNFRVRFWNSAGS